VSTIPSAVSGLTKQEAPSAGVVPGGNTRHCTALMQRYCEYMAPPRIATVLPISACAAGDAPACTTTPAPSLPTGNDCSTRPGVAVALVRVLLPVALYRGNPIGVGEADAADVDVAAVIGDGEAAASDHRDQEPEPLLHVLSPFQSVARPRFSLRNPRPRPR